jgi:hypothetical protein
MRVRKSIIDDNTQATVQCNPVCEQAVLELHNWIFSTYLPKRFPKIYHLDPTSHKVYNTASASSISLDPRSPIEALRELGEHVDAEFTLLLFSGGD